jgi:hypothetical protein
MKQWIHAALTRALKTAAQAAIGVIGTTALVQDMDWRIIAGTVATATLLSVLTSLAGLPEADTPLKGKHMQ